METPQILVTGIKGARYNDRNITALNVPEGKMAFYPFTVVLLSLVIHHLLSVPLTWPSDYHIAHLNSVLTIKCPLEAENIVWNCPAKICKIHQHQKNVTLQGLKHHHAGAYTCFNQDKKTQSYSLYVLILEEEHRLPVHCTVAAYTSTELRCSIAEELACPCLVRAKANSSVIDQNWTEFKISQDRVHSIQFNLTIPEFCPFAEQVNAIHVSVDIITNSDYLTGNQSYYLRDIVTPEAPEIVKVTTEQISWTQPSSWSHSSSFFPLLYEIKVNYRNNTNVPNFLEKQHYSMTDVRKFSVRCRDLFYPGPWSSWRSWAPAH
ncbi:interleukin-12 subunit beta-like [Mixophyes fleayi]|uniref:interleukin-12 subunit beta-like n=1 Tax=Mixophyes fleayi TaxID=3061075 RepID=UPI003F4DCB35